VGNRRANIYQCSRDVAYEQWLRESYVPNSGKTNPQGSNPRENMESSKYGGSLLGGK
jgi:hypothetical protein